VKVKGAAGTSDKYGFEARDLVPASALGPTRRVVGMLAVAVRAANSGEMMNSPLSMQISTFSGFRTTDWRFSCGYSR
jgi:hypothetical protein